MKKILSHLVLLGFLSQVSACSSMPAWMGENDNEAKLEGKRLSILKLESKLVVDTDIDQVKINVPRQEELSTWSNSNGSQYDYPANIKLTEHERKLHESQVIPARRTSRYLTATPIIVDDKIAVMSGLGKIYTYTKNSLNKPLWEKDISPLDEKEEIVGGGMVYQAGKLYVASGHKDILALNIDNGKEVWRHSLNNITRAAPIIEGDKLLVVTIDNKLYALSLLDGRLLWMHEGAEETIGIFGTASMASSQGIVVIPHSSGQLHALNSKDGSEIWSVNLAYSRTSLSGFSFSDIDVTPIIRDGHIYVAGNMGLVYSINLHDGKLLWQREIKGIKSIWGAGDFIYLINSSNELLALYNQDGRVKWIKQLGTELINKQHKSRNSFTGPVMAGDKLVVISIEGKLLFISPLDGKILAEKQIKKKFQLSPVIVGDNIYLLSNNGSLVIY